MCACVYEKVDCDSLVLCIPFSFLVYRFFPRMTVYIIDIKMPKILVFRGFPGMKFTSCFDEWQHPCSLRRDSCSFVLGSVRHVGLLCLAERAQGFIYGVFCMIYIAQCNVVYCIQNTMYSAQHTVHDV